MMEDRPVNMELSKDVKEIDQFLSDYEKYPLEVLTSMWIFERIPYVFNNDFTEYLKVKLIISKSIGVDLCSIFFVGSSSVGFSLNPAKNLKPFDAQSDIDIAIVSHYYFDIAWRTIQDIDFSTMTWQIQNSISEHRGRLIYWETIALDKILGIMPFAKEWMSVLEELKRLPPFRDREVSFRLYRNHEALRRYHINNFHKFLPRILGVEPQSITL